VGGSPAKEDLSSDAVFARIEGIITETLGEDVARLIGIGPQSAFLADLEMDSIQLVAFADRVNALYGDRCNLIAWLSGKPLPALLRLTVGDVVTFIVKGD
jgi:acyl carrier protein